MNLKILMKYVDKALTKLITEYKNMKSELELVKIKILT